MGNNTEDETDSFADSLTDSWVDLMQSPDDVTARNRFAFELHTQVRKFASSGSSLLSLTNLKDDLCQEACLLLFSKLLAGNKALGAATQARHRKWISGQLRRSISAALRFSRWKILKSLGRSLCEIQTEQQLCERASYQHPANITRLCDFSIEVQQQLILEMLRRAMNELALTTDRAELARSLVTNNLTQAEVARSLGISRQAIHQRLNPVWRYLRRAIEDQEFPLS